MGFSKPDMLRHGARVTSRLAAQRQLSSVPPQDWIEMARKETKLPNPVEDLTWHTPEV
jgi:hypothetical protein